MVNIKSKIIQIGDEAVFDTHKILILFGEDVPEYLKDYSIIHRYTSEVTEDLVKKGGKINFGVQTYNVVDVGNIANETLTSLGHASLYFGLEEGAELLPGSILLEPEIMPDLNVGDVIEFISEWLVWLMMSIEF